MENLIKRIEKLEEKRDNGTMTMDEESTLMTLVGLADGFIFKSK